MTTSLLTGASNDKNSLLPLYIRAAHNYNNGSLLFKQGERQGISKGLFTNRQNLNKNAKYAVRYEGKLILFDNQDDLSEFLNGISGNNYKWGAQKQKTALKSSSIGRLFSGQLSSNSFFKNNSRFVETKNYVNKFEIDTTQLTGQRKKIEIFDRKTTVQPVQSLLFGKKPAGGNTDKSFFNVIDDVEQLIFTENYDRSILPLNQ